MGHFHSLVWYTEKNNLANSVQHEVLLCIAVCHFDQGSLEDDTAKAVGKEDERFLQITMTCQLCLI